MKCEICHKNDATTAYTHIVDDTKKTLLLCASCVPQNEEKKKAVPRPKEDESVQSVPELIKKVKVEFLNKLKFLNQRTCKIASLNFF